MIIVVVVVVGVLIFFEEANKNILFGKTQNVG